jgi:hypothetical protein
MDRMNRTFEKRCLEVINGNVILQARMKYTITAYKNTPKSNVRVVHIKYINILIIKYVRV